MCQHNFRYGIGNLILFGKKVNQKVKCGSPHHRLERGQHLGRYDGGDGICRIMETVGIIKYQRKANNNNQDWCNHQRYAFLTKMDSITLAASSHISVAVSSDESISLYLINRMASVSYKNRSATARSNT